MSPAPDRTPRPVWQWLFLLTPAVEMLAVCGFANGMAQQGAAIGLLIYNLIVFALLCFGLGIWWMRREQHAGAQIFLGLLAGVGIAIVNGLIAFAGCSTLLKV